MGNKGLFPGRVSEANQGRGQPRRGYRRPKPATHSGAGRKSCRAACFLWYFLSLRKKVLPSSGRKSLRPRRSRRVNPRKGVSLQHSHCIQWLADDFPRCKQSADKQKTSPSFFPENLPFRVAFVELGDHPKFLFLGAHMSRPVIRITVFSRKPLP